MRLEKKKKTAAAEIRAETNSYLNLTRLENRACGDDVDVWWRLADTGGGGGGGG